MDSRQGHSVFWIANPSHLGLAYLVETITRKFLDFGLEPATVLYLKCKIHSVLQAKEKYRGVFEIQRSGDKTSSGEIGLDIRTYASHKVGQDQVQEFLDRFMVVTHIIDRLR